MPEFHIVSPYRMAGDQPQAGREARRVASATVRGADAQGRYRLRARPPMANIIDRHNARDARSRTIKRSPRSCYRAEANFPGQRRRAFRLYCTGTCQPEAYIASTDTYIEKDSAINDEIDRLRHSATSALAERRDVIIVSSVSCIYSLGDPIDYKSMVISLRPGMELGRDTLIRRLIDIQYERNDIAFERNRFRVRGDTVEIWPVYSDEDVVRVEFFGDEVDRISRINPLTGVPLGELGHIAIFPASHYVTP